MVRGAHLPRASVPPGRGGRGSDPVRDWTVADVRQQVFTARSFHAVGGLERARVAGRRPGGHDRRRRHRRRRGLRQDKEKSAVGARQRSSLREG